MNKLSKSIFFIFTSMLVFGTLLNGTCFGSTNGNGEYWQTVGFDYDIHKACRRNKKEDDVQEINGDFTDKLFVFGICVNNILFEKKKGYSFGW